MYSLLNEVFFSVLACIGHLAEAGSPSLRGNEKYYIRNFINGKYNTIFCDNKKKGLDSGLSVNQMCILLYPMKSLLLFSGSLPSSVESSSTLIESFQETNS